MILLLVDSCDFGSIAISIRSLAGRIAAAHTCAHAKFGGDTAREENARNKGQPSYVGPSYYGGSPPTHLASATAGFARLKRQGKQ